MRLGSVNGITDFIVCLKPDNLPIGKMGVWNAKQPEIGFLITCSQWQRGLASEGLNAVLPYLFEQRGFDEIVADIDPRNEGSKALLERVGFVEEKFEERSMQVGDEWVDTLWLKLTRERWQTLHPAH